MSVLTHDEIIKRITDKSLVIDPFSHKSVGPASVDLHLGKHFRVFKQVKEVYRVIEEANFEEITEVVEASNHFLLLPGQIAHTVTQERIVLPDTLCAWIQGRSRFGRLGLMVHITASFVQPGSAGQQVLEIGNAGPIPLQLSPGLAICQLILEEVVGSASYQGRFKNQKKP